MSISRKSLLAILLMATSACDVASRDSLDSALVTLGFSDPEPEPPLTVDLVADGSPGSCGGSLATIVDETRFAATALSTRPGSLIRVWALATATDEARIVYEARAPEASNNWRARSAETGTFVETTVGGVTEALGPVLAGAAEARVSPIASTIDRVLLADSVGAQRFVLLVTDGRERYAGRNLECGHPPTPGRFRAMLGRHDLLRPNSIETTTHVQFVAFEMLRLPGRSCRATVARERAIRAAWTEVIRTAGAASVSFRTGHAEFAINQDVPVQGAPGEAP